jgi:hypothetical protein
VCVCVCVCFNYVFVFVSDLKNNYYVDVLASCSLVFPEGILEGQGASNRPFSPHPRDVWCALIHPHVIVRVTLHAQGRTFGLIHPFIYESTDSSFRFG